MDDKQKKATILGQRLKQIRENLHLSQKEFADKVSYSQQYISHCERGYRLIPTELLLEICEKFGIDLGYFDPYKTPQAFVLQSSTLLEKLDNLKQTIKNVESEIIKST